MDIKTAFIREFKEETGIGTLRSEIGQSVLLEDTVRQFATITYPDFDIHVFTGTAQFPATFTKTVDEGLVRSIALPDIESMDTLNNNKWLISMALDVDPEFQRAILHYEYKE